IVCEPVSSEDSDVGFPACGSCGRPREVVSTTVPVSGGSFWSWLISASSWPGVLTGSTGDACADGICVPAITPPVTATAMTGTAHRPRLDSVTRILLTRSLLPPPVIQRPRTTTVPQVGCEGAESVIRAWPAVGDTVPVRVLVVEDERRLAAAVKRGLEASGFVVDVAFDGVTGLHMAREGGYDGVVLDIMLPGLSGYKVCEKLRAEENWVPVLFLSAKDGEYDQADGLDLGGDDYLTKPFSYVVLAARLRALLRRGAVPRPAVLQAGDLSLDPASRVVRRGPVCVELTAREFSLLEYLMRRGGAGGSKGQAPPPPLGDPGGD